MSILKATCLAIYALALAGLAGLLPSPLGSVMQTLAAVMLLAHVLELVFMFKQVRLYPGPLASSVLLTLLFGLFHWLPLARAQSRKK